MSAAPDDRAEFFERLRASSARLLKLNPDHLSAAQSVRVDRCAALRLLLDRMASQQLAGGEIDAKSYISASTELERLLGGEPNAPTSPLASVEAQSRMRALIETTVLGPDAAEQDVRDQKLLAVFHAIERGGNADALRAELEQLISAVLPAPSPAADAAAAPVSPRETSSQPPLARPDAPLPAHYLRDRPREAWYDPNAVGNVIPWVR